MIYKLVADWDEININDFVRECQNNNIDVCFDGDRRQLLIKWKERIKLSF